MVARARHLKPGWDTHTLPVCLLALAGLLVSSLVAWPILQPGTMDSHYYYGGGRSLLENHAFVEPFIWNYLHDPPSLPAPSHLYWMPLPSILVALSQALFGPSFKVAQIPFVLLAALLPLVSYATSWSLSHNRRHALIAGLLTVFSGFYMPYWTIPETFAPFAVVAGLALYGLGRYAEHGRGLWPLGLGLLAGLGHLCRADGILLLVIGLACTLATERRSARRAVRAVLLLLCGYLLIMAPWFARNWRVIGAPLPTAGTRTMFLRSYDELYSYGTPLNWERYLAWGWGNILRSKLAAGWSNLQTLVAVNNLVFLAPLCLLGLWQTRRRPFLLPAVTFGVALYGTMTLLFTFPGVRGGVFHSSAALLPTIFSASAAGLDVAVDWAAQRRRRWDRRAARRFFSAGLILLAAGMSTYVYRHRVIGGGTWSDPDWNRTDSSMEQVGDWLRSQDAGEPLVMVGNPPAFAYHTGLSAVVIPNERVERTVDAARRYGASYIVLDRNRPEPLEALYSGQVQHRSLRLIWDEYSGAPSGIVVLEVIEAD